MKHLFEQEKTTIEPIITVLLSTLDAVRRNVSKRISRSISDEVQVLYNGRFVAFSVDSF